MLFSAIFLLSLPIISAQLGLGPSIINMNDPASQGTCAIDGDGTTSCAGANMSLPTIILVPGFLGSKMHLDGGQVNYPPDLALCNTSIPTLFPAPGGQWSMKGWINPVLAFSNSTVANPAQTQACILYLMRLKYDNATGTYSNQTNVNTTNEARQPFGSNCPTYCAASDSAPLGCNLSTMGKTDEAYFNNLLVCLADIGYVQGCNIFAAPYDWRLSPNLTLMNPFYAKLINLINNKTADGRKVYLLAHSMGNLVVLNFLNKIVTKEWQQAKIAATINVSSPWAGTVFILEQILSGNAGRFFFGLSLLVSDYVTRQFVRTFAAVAALLPTLLGFPADQVLVTINGTNYTVANLSQLLDMAEIGHLYPLYQQDSASIRPQDFTKMYCVHSCYAQSTPVRFIYNSTIDKRPTTELDYGDTLVNCPSLRVCQAWKDSGNSTVQQVLEYNQTTSAPNQPPTHAGILSFAPFCQFVKELVQQPQ